MSDKAAATIVKPAEVDNGPSVAKAEVAERTEITMTPVAPLASFDDEDSFEHVAFDGQAGQGRDSLVVHTSSSASVASVNEGLSIGISSRSAIPGICPMDGQPLQLVCEVCKTRICVVCWLSRSHAGHKVVALRDLKEQASRCWATPPGILSHLTTLPGLPV